METHVAAFCGAALVSVLVTPVVIRLALAKQLVDRPGKRKIHLAPVPRIGGVVVALAMLAGALPVLLLQPGLIPSLGYRWTQFLAMLSGSLFMGAVGLLDDVYNLRARVKLLAQIVAALAMCSFGIRIEFIGLLNETARLYLGWLSWPVTVVWIVGITNAVNIIDGLDGLAAGIAAITCAAIAIFSLYTQQVVMGLFMLAMLGSLLGFLLYNFNPARVFMGDCGTLFLGFFLGTASVLCTVKAQTMVGLALAVLSLGLPVFDIFFSVLRRVLDRRSPFSPDRGHIHHRLLKLGLHQRSAVVVMYSVTILAAGLGLSMMAMRNRQAVVVFLGVSLLLVLVFRVAGAVRFRDVVSKLQRNWGLARQSQNGLRDLSRLQLRLGEARTLVQYWRCLRLAAREMDLDSLCLTVVDGAGRAAEFRWDSPRLRWDSPAQVRVRLDLPADRWGAQSVAMELSVASNGSLESAARRVGLFGRLLQDGAETVPAATERGTRAGSPPAQPGGLYVPAGATKESLHP